MTSSLTVESMSFQTRARTIVYDFVANQFDKSDPVTPFSLDDVYIVWFCKTLQNWKALVSTTLPDVRYYEVTYNGDKKEVYLDVYTKVTNVVIPDEENAAGN